VISKETKQACADKQTKLVSTELFQSVNAFFVVLLTPLVVAVFGWLRRARKEPSTPGKIALGLFITALSTLVMVAATFATHSGQEKGSAMWLVATYGVITVGELCLSPMGLSLVTKLSPKRYVGLMMGGWFCATAFGNKLSGFFGGVQSLMEPMGFFLVLAGAVAVVAFGIRMLLPWLDRVMKQYGA
jgi:POT family proton-dependent oligopeptide transporter